MKYSVESLFSGKVISVSIRNLKKIKLSNGDGIVNISNNYFTNI